MTVHREQSMKREDQQDATIRCLLLTSVSTCFGYHCTHLQENKGPVTAFVVLFRFCWMWLVAVVGRCVVGCDHYEGFCSKPFYSFRDYGDAHLERFGISRNTRKNGAENHVGTQFRCRSYVSYILKGATTLIPWWEVFGFKSHAVVNDLRVVRFSEKVLTFD